MTKVLVDATDFPQETRNYTSTFKACSNGILLIDKNFFWTSTKLFDESTSRVTELPYMSDDAKYLNSLVLCDELSKSASILDQWCDHHFHRSITTLLWVKWSFLCFLRLMGSLEEKKQSFISKVDWTSISRKNPWIFTHMASGRIY